MFQSLPPVPPDPIFSLLDEFQSDPHPEKINLTIGAWQDEEGRTPVMDCVKLAEKRILASETTKNYLGIPGLREFNDATTRLIYGASSPLVNDGRITCIQTPGGTAALRIAAAFLESLRPQSKLWIGQPTWTNHLNIFSQANVPMRNYEYLTADRKSLNFEAMVDALNEAAEGDAFLFHSGCHNPTGFDLETDQWEIVFGFVRERGLLAVFDCAYQGFRESVEADAWPIRRLAELDTEFLVCSSNSKNFGLYGERVGAISGVCKSVAEAERLSDNLQSIIRAIYSNPPKHGAAIVAALLSEPDLRSMWEEELAGLRQRIIDMRELLMGELEKACGAERFRFLGNQFGMFGYTGLSAEQVDRLRREYSIYMLRSGRINVAGVNHSNVRRLVQCIAAVIGQPATTGEAMSGRR
jgi:aspartate aminotransferase